MKTLLSTIAFFASLVAPSFANATEYLTLKETVVVYDKIVYAKDLFEKIGERGEEPLFLAPDPGKTGTISAYRVLEESEKVGIENILLDNISVISVSRPSSEIKPDDIRARLKKVVEKSLLSKIDFEINTSSLPALVHADVRSEQPLQFDEISFSNDEQQFRTVAKISTYDGVKQFPINGQVVEMTSVLTVARSLNRGDIIEASDLQQNRLPVSRYQGGGISDEQLLIGKALVRRLSERSIIREQDVQEPRIIRSNDLINIRYEIPGLQVNAEGRALDEGWLGKTIQVLNLQSRKVVQARIASANEVVVERTPNVITASRTQ